MERPIIFSGPMVQAILEGRKTQTRRPVKPQPPANTQRMYPEAGADFVGQSGRWYAEYLNAGRPWTDGALYRCPYGKPGDRLWVREAWKCDSESVTAGFMWHYGLTYRADGSGKMERFAKRREDAYQRDRDGWRPSIHMPRWASRLTLEVVSVRVERVQDITEDDIRAEGVVCSDCVSASPRWGHCCCRLLFRVLWSQIYDANGYGWDANPWVWVVEFRVAERKEA